jgi:hypothetical protein
LLKDLYLFKDLYLNPKEDVPWKASTDEDDRLRGSLREWDVDREEVLSTLRKNSA